MFIRSSIAAIVVGAGVLSGLALPRVALASSARAGCVIGGYSTTASKCVTVPDTGKFSIKVPHTHTTLVGTGSSSDAGTKIHVVAVANPPHTSGVAIRVTASGAFPPLHLKSGKLYRYDPKTGEATSVKKLTKPGIFIVKA
jgi:hypothetical protein